MMALIYSPEYLKHRTFNHPESPQRLISIMNSLEESGLINEVTIQTPHMAKEDDLRRIHSKEHVEHVKSFCEGGGGYLDPDTYTSPESYQIARLAAGGTITAAELALESFSSGYSMVRPPGHHATPDRAMGFCLFNNLAVALEHLRETKNIKKFAIFDFDVHYGNGTAEIFYNDPDVLYISIHQDPHTIFPSEGFVEEIGHGPGEGYNLNIPVAPGSKTSDYIYLLERILKPVFEDFGADFYFYDVGFDAHQDDPLSRVLLDDYFFEWMAMEIVSQPGPAALTLEGGYNLESLARCNLKMINVLTHEITIEDQKLTREDYKVREETKILFKKIEDNFSPFFTF
ncbi:MAG: acetylpolyamine amidohydrolase [Methanobacteriales archaeon Met13]